MIREQPWHTRFVTTEHERRHQSIVRLHHLTKAWLDTLGVERPSHFLIQSTGAQIRESVHKMEKLAELAIAPFGEHSVAGILDDTYPEDSLARFQNAVETLQGWTLQAVLDRAKDQTERANLLSQLEQASFKNGREVATRLWLKAGQAPPSQSRGARSQAEPGHTGPNPAVYEDLRLVLSAVASSPLMPCPDSPVLKMRELPDTIEWGLLNCPHRHASGILTPVVDLLCTLHSHWMRGYLYALNPRIEFEHTIQTPGAPHGLSYCTQRWRAHS